LAVVVVGSVLAFGSVDIHVLAFVAIGALLTASFAVYRQAQTQRGVWLPLPAIFLCVLAAYTLAQTVPMPLRWLEAIAPTNARVWAQCLLPFGERSPTWAPISLDPGASWVEALRWTTYALVFLAASAVASRHGATWGVLIVFGAALAVALVTLVHAFVGATRLYDLRATGASTLIWHTSPLINPNNQAGYLNLGAFSGLGLLLARRAPVSRVAVGAGVVLVVCVSVASGSRAGVVALPLGLLALAMLRRGAAPKSSRPRLSLWLITSVIAAGVGLAALGSNDAMRVELLDRDLTKLQMVFWVGPLVRDHPVVGIGRGAFESVFPAYSVTPGNVLYTHPENFVMQWIAEWGLPVGVTALVGCAWAFQPRHLGARTSGLAAGAWAGVAALLAQNLLDLALEVPAVCIAIVVVLGSLWGDRQIHGPRPGLRLGALGASKPWIGAGLVIFAGVGVLAGTLGLGTTVAVDRSTLHRAYDRLEVARSNAIDAARADLRRAVLAHPAEPSFPLLGGVLAFRARDQDPFPWIQQALERRRIYGGARLFLAQVLAARGATHDGLTELRRSARDDPALVAVAAELAMKWARSYDDLLAAVPAGNVGARMLDVLGGLLAAVPGNDGPRGLCDREAVRRDPTLLAPRVREAIARIDALAPDALAGACADRSRCRAEILEHIEAIEGAHPEASISLGLRARLLQVQGRNPEAVKILEVGCVQKADRLSCLQARVAAAARLEAPEPLDAAGRDLLIHGCATAGACAGLLDWLASVHFSRGESSAALRSLRRAASEDPPRSEGRWLRVAEVAGARGAHREAADALEKVASLRGGSDPELKRRIEAERDLAVRGWLQR
jgi:O-Antigen ligase